MPHAMRTTTREEAEELVRHTGERTTRPRVEVLAVLLAAERALTHHEVEERIDPGLGIDRVTVYRVLDWLSARGLAHSVAGGDRLRRYNAAGSAEDTGSHAHFQCERCASVICLEEPRRTLRIRVPSGFITHDIVLTVKGLCVRCAGGRSSAHQRHGAAPRQKG